MLEGMAMLDTTVRQRISVVVYADLEAAYTYLVDVFALGPGSLPAAATEPSCTARCRPATA